MTIAHINSMELIKSTLSILANLKLLILNNRHNKSCKFCLIYFVFSVAFTVYGTKQPTL